jgi:hypothetical protein
MRLLVLALEPKKRLKRPDGGLGSGGKGAENSPPGPPFSANFSQVQRLMRLITCYCSFYC